MLSTSNISDVNYYLNTKYFSLAREQLLDDKQFAGSLIHDLLIDQKFNKEDFTNLCKGKITTANGEYIELGRKNKDGELEHDMGRDLTFSAPKSVSLQHNIGFPLRRYIFSPDSLLALILSSLIAQNQF